MANLSIAVPLYNEELSVEPLYRGIASVLDGMDGNHEIIFIDDGSSDGTFRRAEQLATEDSRLRVVKFRRNYGQTPAMAAGIDLASREVVVTMDGDLQNDPRDIPMMVSKLDEGYDIVVGWRFQRKDKLISRKIPSMIANWLIGKVTGVPIKDNGCSLKAFRADVIKQIPLYSEMHRFIPAMASMAGPRLAQVKVRHHARQFGDSKYGLSRVFKVLLDLMAIKTIASFASQPMYWFYLLAVPSLLLSIIVLFVGIFGVFLESASLPIAGSGLILGELSIFLLLTGIFAELVSRISPTKFFNMPKLTAKEVRLTDGPGTGESSENYHE